MLVKPRNHHQTRRNFGLVVRVCMWLERTTRLGAPTSVLGILRDRVLLTGVAADAVAMDPIDGDDDHGSDSIREDTVGGPGPPNHK